MAYGPFFVLAIVAMAFLAKIIQTNIRAKHGYLLDDDRSRGRRRGGDDERLLMADNRALTGKVEQLEDRLAVLERIATDPGRRLSDEIDRLRGAED